MIFTWFRFYHEWIGDTKVQTMPFHWQRHLIAIFCWHSSGELKGLDDGVLAEAFRMPPKELAEMKAAFKKRGFIAGSGWTPKNWEKRQRPTDHSAPRVAAFRARKKEKKSAMKRDGNVTHELRNATVTAQEQERERREKERDEFSDENSSVVVVVTREDVTDQKQENGKPSNASTITSQNPVQNGEPSLACIDALIPEIDNTWPDANWGVDAYGFAKAFLPHCVVYGFRTAIAKAWKGEKVTLSRVRGFIEWAQQNGITPDEAFAVETRSNLPARAKEKPKTKTELLHESIDRSNARLKAKGVKEASMSTLEIAQAEEREKANEKSGE